MPAGRLDSLESVQRALIGAVDREHAPVGDRRLIELSPTAHRVRDPDQTLNRGITPRGQIQLVGHVVRVARHGLREILYADLVIAAADFLQALAVQFVGGAAEQQDGGKRGCNQTTERYIHWSSPTASDC